MDNYLKTNTSDNFISGKYIYYINTILISISKLAHRIFLFLNAYFKICFWKYFLKMDSFKIKLFFFSKAQPCFQWRTIQKQTLPIFSFLEKNKNKVLILFSFLLSNWLVHFFLYFLFFFLISTILLFLISS